MTNHIPKKGTGKWKGTHSDSETIPIKGVKEVNLQWETSAFMTPQKKWKYETN
jgi:hypothetical protein